VLGAQPALSQPRPEAICIRATLPAMVALSAGLSATRPVTELMPRKPDATPKQDDPEQSKRFVEAAKVAGGSEEPKDFDKAFSKVTARKKSP